MEYNWQLFNNDTSKMLSFTGNKLDPEGIMNPCGLIARSVFNDTYSLTNSADGSLININETGIIRDKDKVMYIRQANYSNTQWIDVENEHFIVWMYMQTFANFQKRWGTIASDLEKGSYKLTIQNNYDVSSFGSTKSFKLVSVNGFGGGSFFGYALIIAAGICLVSLLILSYIKLTKNNRFDESNLIWY